MELDELEERLSPFSRAKYDDADARVSDVHKMPGHAGFSYGFSVESRGLRESWFLRMPPPNVNWRGTSDVLRQVEVLNALDALDAHAELAVARRAVEALRGFEAGSAGS